MIRERTRLLRDAFGYHGGYMGRAFKFESMALVGMIYWWLLPRSVSMVHVHDDDCGLHPWGARWRNSVAFPHLQCSHCRSIHPGCFLDELEELTRWDPYKAHAEMLQLIERGDALPTYANAIRSGHAPDGCFIAYIHSYGNEWGSINVHTGECSTLTLRLSHLSDVSDKEFFRMRDWLGSNMPELTIRRDDRGRVLSSYDPSADPMIQGARSAAVVLHIHEHDDDYEDDEPQGGPNE